jgi:cell division protein FtsZ
MRVSVVATGIDAAAKVAPVPQPTRSGVSFGTVAGGFGAPASVSPRSAAPVAAEPAPAPVVEEPVAEIVEQTVVEAAPAPQPVAELELDLSNAIEEEPAPVNVTPLRPEPVRSPEPVAVEPAPVAAPRPMRGAPVEEERPLTLFERMMNLSRGAPKAKADAAPAPSQEPDASQDPLEIPRFFKRQVND